MTTIENAIASIARAIAHEADQMIRDRYDLGYEVLYDGEHHTFVIASPRNVDELAEPGQPTAVCIGDAYDFDDAEQLYREALRHTDEVDKLVQTAEEW